MQDVDWNEHDEGIVVANCPYKGRMVRVEPCQVGRSKGNWRIEMLTDKTWVYVLERETKSLAMSAFEEMMITSSGACMD